MTITLSPQTETLLREQAAALGKDADTLANSLLQNALEDAARDFEESCAAIAEGFADIEAGQTVSLEEARAQFEARRAERRRQREASAPVAAAA